MELLSPGKEELPRGQPANLVEVSGTSGRGETGDKNEALCGLSNQASWALLRTS